ncbi:MAG: polyprenyl synthetase family protein [Thermodesulfovibrionales bacterium]|nr:polyprenyl synthetase family protein [Thermodesulfovibrionales bacterium]
MSSLEIKSYLSEKKQLIDNFLIHYLSSSSIKPEKLKESMLYSLSAGGKRIRPILCMAAYEACGGKDIYGILPYASALELVHTYSLIHDDLPSMDDDDLRRGKPTNHKLFGEAIAILAGDALLTEAFYMISSYSLREHTKLSARSVLTIISELAYEIGANGMVSGQAQDILSEDSEPDAEILYFIHSRKTAAFITASVKIGGILADCSSENLESLTKYGRYIGLGFQIIDDILDIEGEIQKTGKTTGSDEKKNKLTYPKLYGLEMSRIKAIEAINNALVALSDFDSKADVLRAIASYLLIRKN